MFGPCGHWINRAAIFILAGWIILLVGTRLAAPPWSEVAQDREFIFLPPDSPSRRGEEIFGKAFPEDQSASNIVLVLYRDKGETQLEQDKKFIETVLEPELRKIADTEGGFISDTSSPAEPLFADDSEAPKKSAGPPPIIARLRTPNAPGVGGLLVSADHRVLLVALELTTEFLSNQNWPLIAKIENLVADLHRDDNLPAGMDVALTGSAVIGRDHTVAELQSVRATSLLTVIFVVALLLLIYRAPLLALIPLATVFLAVEISLNLLAMLAGAGHITLFQGIQIYITILAYGAGVDYCLFFTARYKEELDTGHAPAEAVAAAIRDVRAALTASAFTVIGGIAMMVFARFGKFREAGVAIPFAICIVLAATLSFSPALLRLTGRWAFWPQQNKKWFAGPAEPSGRLARMWRDLAIALSLRPGRLWLITVSILLPFAIAAVFLYGHVSYDLIGDLPATAPSVAGTNVLKQHFPSGIIGQSSFLLVNQQVDFADSEGRNIVAGVTNQLKLQRQQLELADVRSLTAPLGISAAAANAIASGVGERRGPPVTVTTAASSNPDLKKLLDREARKHYVTSLGERGNPGTRFDLVFNHNPFSHATISDLDQAQMAILASLPADLRANSQLFVTGPTAGVRDLQAVVQGDRTRIEVLVLAGVFLILVLLLREVLVPIYLLVSVLFSYYATLGVSFLVFWLLDPSGFAGIDWKVAIFLFTILIAVGEDYNIFLMARVRQEQKSRGPVPGITTALTRTGPIISSCGLIMAGTFASLGAGSLSEMKQLGFALAFGVLLDTFVVRPILVPAFLLLRRTHRIFPARKCAFESQQRNDSASGAA